MKSLWQTIKDCYYVVSGQAERDRVASAIRQLLNEDQVRRGIPTNLEGYRTKFRRNLLGYWSSNHAYYGPFAVTSWHFFADGTALEWYSSGSGNDKTRYLWRECDDFAIELLQLETETDRKEEIEEDDDDEEDTPSNWFRLPYDFKMEGETIVLFQTPEDETYKFHFTLESLKFDGDLKQEKREEP